MPARAAKLCPASPPVRYKCTGREELPACDVASPPIGSFSVSTGADDGHHPPARTFLRSWRSRRVNRTFRGRCPLGPNFVNSIVHTIEGSALFVRTTRSQTFYGPRDTGEAGLLGWAVCVERGEVQSAERVICRRSGEAWDA